MTTFRTQPLSAHNHPDEVEIDLEVAAFTMDDKIVSDLVALAIAGWFSASPDETPALSALITDGEGNTGELGAEIKVTIEEDGFTGQDLNRLHALDAWVAAQEG